MSLRSVHIVRKYGPFGGMERYVWELTHALRALGEPVSVICEEQLQVSHPDIQVIQTGAVAEKPRWISMLRFSSRLPKALSQIPNGDRIIHSHERSSIHQVTSFHGPSILSRRRRWSDWFSARLRVWEYLERREVEASQVRAILPNSDRVATQLAELYPAARHRLSKPAYPGVGAEFFPADGRPDKKIIGFIGREWRRKGLAFAARVVGSMREKDPDIRFKVAGCHPEEVKSLFEDWQDGVELLGWCDPAEFYRQIDLLILPSANEPFGMVVAEANASNVPVLISDECGIASLISSDHGEVLTLDNEPENLLRWQQEGERLLMFNGPVVPLGLTWAALAKQHVALYAAVT